MGEKVTMAHGMGSELKIVNAYPARLNALIWDEATDEVTRCSLRQVRRFAEVTLR